MFRPIASLAKALGGFPLLAFPVLIYALSVWTSGPGVLDNAFFSIPTVNSGPIAIEYGEFLVLLAAAFLLPEWFKATDTSDLAIVEMLLSLGLAFLCLVLLISFQSFATATFLTITVMQIVDGLGGVAAVRVARRDWGIGST